METPELDKALALEVEIKGAGMLLDSFAHQNIVPCKWSEEREEFVPVTKSYSTLVADAMGLSEEKMENEKRSLLKSLQS